MVHNSTVSSGIKFDSIGTAKYLGDSAFRVDFPQPEIAKYPNASFGPPGPNYIVDKIFTNCEGDYIFAIVTDPTKQNLYVLSRYQHPSVSAYTQIMYYITTNYDIEKIYQIPHF